MAGVRTHISSIELHRDTEPFEGRSTDWATEPRHIILFVLYYKNLASFQYSWLVAHLTQVEVRHELEELVDEVVLVEVGRERPDLVQDFGKVYEDLWRKDNSSSRYGRKEMQMRSLKAMGICSAVHF